MAVCAQSSEVEDGDRQHHHPYMTNTDTGTVVRGDIGTSRIEFMIGMMNMNDVFVKVDNSQ